MNLFPAVRVSRETSPELSGKSYLCKSFEFCQKTSNSIVVVTCYNITGGLEKLWILGELTA